MDGVHDLGGMHGFGALSIEEDEPAFHEPWEGRVWVMAGALVRRTTVDRFRYTIEQMPPAEYLSSRYYERWLWAAERMAQDAGLLGAGEQPVARPSPSEPMWSGRFQEGDEVRVRNTPTAAHTRVPRYLRRAQGRVQRVACAWPNPTESASAGTYGRPELVYTVAFAGADLFGVSADHTLLADLCESDLETT